MEDTKRQQTTGVLILLFICFLILRLSFSSSEPEKKKEKSLMEETKPFFESSLKAAHPNQFQLRGKKATYHLSAHGARVTKVVLKNYKNQKGKPLALHTRSSGLDVELTDKKEKKIRTYALNFDGEKDSAANRVIFTHAKETDREIRVTYEVKDNALRVAIKVGNAWDGDSVARLREVTALQNQERYIDKARGQTYLYYGKKNGSYSHIDGKGGMFGGGSTIDLKETPYISLFTPYFLQSIITNADGIKSVVTLKAASDATTTLKTAAIEMDFPTKTLQKGHVLIYYFGENTSQALQAVNKLCTQKINFENNFPTSYRWFFPFSSMANTYVIAPLFNVLHGATNNPLLAFFLMIFLILILVTFFGYFNHVYNIKMKGAKSFIAKVKAEHESDGRMMESMLYRKLGINPLVLLLNAFVGIVFVIATITFLQYNIVFRGVRFLWAPDISTHDGWIRLPFYVPMFGRYITGFGILSLVLTLLFRDKKPLETTPGKNHNEVTQSMTKMMKYLSPVLTFWYVNTRGVVIVLGRLAYTLSIPVKKILFNRIVDSDKINRQISEKIEEVKKEQQPTTSRAISRLEKRSKK